MDVPRRALPADLTQRTMVSTFSILLIECIIITLMQITLNLERRLYFWSTCTALNLRVWRDPKYCVFITAYCIQCTAHPFYCRFAEQTQHKTLSGTVIIMCTRIWVTLDHCSPQHSLSTQFRYRDLLSVCVLVSRLDSQLLQTQACY